MKTREYNRNEAVEYAEKWAYRRNPRYYNFNELGGDCTSFASQCIYAGSKIMNYKKYIGWYYNNLNNRAPSWSGVEFLHDFLINLHQQQLGVRLVIVFLEAFFYKAIFETTKVR